MQDKEADASPSSSYAVAPPLPQRRFVLLCAIGWRKTPGNWLLYVRKVTRYRLLLFVTSLRLIADRISVKVNAIVCVRLSVRLFPLYSYLLTFDREFCKCMSHDHSSPGLKVKVTDQGQCRNVCATRVSTVVSYEYWLTAVIVDYYCQVISCALARPGVRCGAAGGQGEIQRVWAW